MQHSRHEVLKRFLLKHMLLAHLLLRWGGAISTVCECLAVAAETHLHGLTLQHPDEFELKLVAGPPLVERPIHVARDERGRLYVTDSAGMSYKADQQLAHKPHRIRRLSDEDGDGQYDHSTLFVDGLMLPEGCLWYQGALYVAAPPQIWKFVDRDDDGIAERREIWYDGKTLTGCANDLHGPYLGLDGWFYFCKGAFAEQRHQLPRGRMIVSRSSHIFRARADGSLLEPVLTGGMDNPVGVAFHSTGERFLSCTFFQFPSEGCRDGLIHAIYGGVYGKKHESIYEHPMTGDVMPVLSHQGPAAPSGVIAGSRSLFGGRGRDHLYACYFNLHRVIEHRLIPHGTTFTTDERPLLACDHPDFHPTDVYEDADGSLLIVNTGGWYRICCPTSQIARPEVLGAIYRLQHREHVPPEDPLGNRLSWQGVTVDELVHRLADQRLFVRRRAAQSLQQLGSQVIGHSLRSWWADQPAQVRSEFVWAVNEPEIWLHALRDSAPEVRQAAVHQLALHREVRSVEALTKVLLEDMLPVARVAAEGLGRIGEAQAIPALMQAVDRCVPTAWDETGAPADPSERIWEHALIYALYEIGETTPLTKWIQHGSPRQRRVALIAWHLINPQSLSPQPVLDLLRSPDAWEQYTAIWLSSRHTDWAEWMLKTWETLLDTLDDAATTKIPRETLTRWMASLARSVQVQQWMANQSEVRQGEALNVLIEAMGHAPLTTVPPAWQSAWSKLLSRLTADQTKRLLQTLQRWPLPKGPDAELAEALVRVAQSESLAWETRLDAMIILGAKYVPDPQSWNTVLQALASNQPYSVRHKASQVTAQVHLSPQLADALIDRLHHVGPLELQRVLIPFEKSKDPQLVARLLDRLHEHPFVEVIQPDTLRRILQSSRLPESPQSRALLKRLEKGEDQGARLDEMMSWLSQGDPQRGHALFIGKKAQCIQCHTLGYLGGKLGPDLTNIGKVRTERDLLEAILFPSASLVRGYEPVVIELHDGRALTGIVAHETQSDLTLMLDPQRIERIRREDIADMYPSTTSLMPQGLDKLLSPQEIADLIAFLKAGPR
ncbi:MAG: hypothetical protein KatS3mg113_0866 [Planctomycetaceae bacterium]|nr:MAG: hypothetical protein KatS3mg113_0866 [Planctomycetaceae bacterium]